MDQTNNIDILNAKKQLRNQKARKRYALLSVKEKDKSMIETTKNKRKAQKIQIRSVETTEQNNGLD